MRFFQYLSVLSGLFFSIISFAILMSPASVAVGTGLGPFGFFLTAAIPAFLSFVAADCFKRRANKGGDR